MEDLVSYLFKTNAIKACSADKPFWYTSGKLGAYFISAEFLYGSDEESKELLSHVDEALSDHQTLPKKVFDEVLAQYNTNEIYKFTIDSLVKMISDKVNVDEIDYISGGERRDWLFSVMVANLLKKPHITVFKDLSALVSTYDFSNTEKVDNLSGKNVLHVSDLINTAASYTRAWIPIIENLGGDLKWTATTVDRIQGGTEILENHGITTYALVNVNKELFKTACEKGIISEAQFEIIDNYMDNPDETMKAFIKAHPEFVTESLKGTGKTLERANRFINENIYGLGESFK